MSSACPKKTAPSINRAGLLQNQTYLHKLLYALVSVLPEERLQRLHALRGEQPVPVRVVIVVDVGIIVKVIVVVVVHCQRAQREEGARARW